MVAGYLISEKQSRLFWATAAIVVCLFVLTGCDQDMADKSENYHDGFCTSIISIGLDGHYLLNRSVLTKENAERINDCVKTLRIRNVCVVSDVSEYP